MKLWVESKRNSFLLHVKPRERNVSDNRILHSWFVLLLTKKKKNTLLWKHNGKKKVAATLVSQSNQNAWNCNVNNPTLVGIETTSTLKNNDGNSKYNFRKSQCVFFDIPTLPLLNIVQCSCVFVCVMWLKNVLDEQVPQFLTTPPTNSSVATKRTLNKVRIVLCLKVSLIPPVILFETPSDHMRGGTQPLSVFNLSLWAK